MSSRHQVARLIGHLVVLLSREATRPHGDEVSIAKVQISPIDGAVVDLVAPSNSTIRLLISIDVLDALLEMSAEDELFESEDLTSTAAKYLSIYVDELLGSRPHLSGQFQLDSASWRFIPRG